MGMAILERGFSVGDNFTFGDCLGGSFGLSGSQRIQDILGEVLIWPVDNLVRGGNEEIVDWRDEARHL